MEPLIDTRGVIAPVSHSSSVTSWGAIIAGAVVAAAVTLVVGALGTGLGLASISPWADRGVSATTFEIATAIGYVIMQWISSAAGGYLTGRLRTRWIGTHPHEVFFRDTAHGFIAWSLATLMVATVIAVSLASVISKGAQGAGGIAAAGVHGAAAGMSADPSTSYGMDKLFRTDPAGSTGPSAPEARAETARIVAQTMTSNAEVPEADRVYLGNLVAAKTGVSAEDAKKRVDDFIAAARDVETKVKAAADAARKATAEAALYTALSMLVGAFIACVAAALGGRIRDEHV